MTTMISTTARGYTCAGAGDKCCRCRTAGLVLRCLDLEALREAIDRSPEPPVLFATYGVKALKNYLGWSCGFSSTNSAWASSSRVFNHAEPLVASHSRLFVINQIATVVRRNRSHPGNPGKQGVFVRSSHRRFSASNQTRTKMGNCRGTESSMRPKLRANWHCPFLQPRVCPTRERLRPSAAGSA